MKTVSKILSVIIAVFFALLPLSVFAEDESGPESAAPVYQITLKCTVNGSIPAGTRFDFTVKCFAFDENDEESAPLSTETITLDTSVNTERVYTFKNSEVESGGRAYEFTLTGSSDESLLLDSRSVTVYLGSEIIKLIDSSVAGEEKNFDTEDVGKNRNLLQAEFQSTRASVVTIDTKSAEAVTKVYDGTTGAKVTAANYKLNGIANGHDVKLSYKKAEFDSSNVTKASKVTVTGLSLAGADAGKYKLSADSFECIGKITARPITVTADDLVMTEGEEEPELTYKLSEELVGDVKVVGSLAREPGTTAGEYTITRGTLSFGDNYDVKFVEGTLTVSSFGLAEITDPITSIKVSGYFDPNSTLQITLLDAENNTYKSLASGAAWGKIAATYDILLNASRIDGNITVTFPVGSQYEGKPFAIYQQMSNGSVICYRTTVVSGVVTVSTSECTQFMLVTDKDTKESGGSTGKTVLKVILIILLIIVGIALLLLLFFFGMIFFNKTEQLKRIIKKIKRIFKK